eukprot:10108-Pelagococcus_subviridis.AAC.3
MELNRTHPTRTCSSRRSLTSRSIARSSCSVLESFRWRTSRSFSSAALDASASSTSAAMALRAVPYAGRSVSQSKGRDPRDRSNVETEGGTGEKRSHRTHLTTLAGFAPPCVCVAPPTAAPAPRVPPTNCNCDDATPDARSSDSTTPRSSRASRDSRAMVSASSASATADVCDSRAVSIAFDASDAARFATASAAVASDNARLASGSAVRVTRSYAETSGASA